MPRGIDGTGTLASFFRGLGARWRVMGVALGVACATAPPGAPPERTAAATARPDVEADEFAARRQRMVADQIAARGVRDPRVLEVMRTVPRHRFVPAELVDEAYGDHPLPIGFGQTISQPYIVAYMTEALQVEPHHRVLEIGTGSGYQAAVLAALARQVYTIEIVPELAERARTTLESLGIANVEVRVGDGYLGWPEQAPFDRIMVTAAPPELPQPLVDQLAVGGRLLAPVGVVDQWIRIVRREADRIFEETTIPVRFVPLVRPKP